jgi:uncharacterized repeat protein (TIGR03803 family)
MKLSAIGSRASSDLIAVLWRVALFGAFFSSIGIVASASALNTLHEFRSATTGAAPVNNIVLADGKLYGTTWVGDGGSGGTIWSLDVQDHSFSKLYSFGESDGSGPIGGVTFDGGKLYGTTYLSVGVGGGTIWSYDVATSMFTNLHTFGLGDGSFSNGGVAIAGDTLYGTTRTGGAFNEGTIWSLDLENGGFQKRHDFAISGSVGGVAIVGNRLIGTTYDDRFGLDRGDSVWALDLDNNSFTTLHTFDRHDEGSGVLGNLAISGDYAFGTAAADGEYGAGSLWRINLTNGDFAVLHDFTDQDGHASRIAEFVYDGKILGVGWEGGATGAGTLWMYDIPSASFELLHSFDRSRNEYHPNGGIVLAGSTIFGTLKEGGATYDGSIWSYSIPEPSPVVMALAALLTVVQPVRHRRSR